MSENQNPEIETTDTSDAVEGHGFSSGRIEADEVEGHVMRGKLVADEAEDVEGHGIASNRGISSGRGASVGRFRPDEDEMFGEDVQGHSMRGKLVESESESDGGGDDVEGHGIGAGRSIGSGRGASPAASRTRSRRTSRVTPCAAASSRTRTTPRVTASSPAAERTPAAPWGPPTPRRPARLTLRTRCTPGRRRPGWPAPTRSGAR